MMANIEERSHAFDRWLMVVGHQIGYYRLPSSVQSRVHRMLRKAFNSGSNWRKETEKELI